MYVVDGGEALRVGPAIGKNGLCHTSSNGGITRVPNFVTNVLRYNLMQKLLIIFCILSTQTSPLMRHGGARLETMTRIFKKPL